MGDVSVEQIVVTPLSRIRVSGGDVLRALRSSDEEFRNFGEAYFSFVEVDVVKAWKMHHRMTLNLVVPIGEVRFQFIVEDEGEVRDIRIGKSNYSRLTVPPGIWFGFQGLDAPESLILNVADIVHDPLEVSHKSVSEISIDWD